ncbi:MAG: hypothetical protein KF784_10310 [Fimbriimonadaceae bacterium]|nr:hypothetical protein [Fimbriimonadaceae bacterium]
MIRYQGQPLPKNPRIALISNDAIGNYAIATSILAMIKAELKPSQLIYFGGMRVAEFQTESKLEDISYPYWGLPDSKQGEIRARHSGQIDLVVNLEISETAQELAASLAGGDCLVSGPCAGLPYPNDLEGKLWQDQEWIAEDIVGKYPFLKSGFIVEIFARLCYLKGDILPYQLPSSKPNREVPDVLIAMSASLPEKLWPLENWKEIMGWLNGRGLSVGLLGAKPTDQSKFWMGAADEQALVDAGLVADLRGVFTLPGVVGAIDAAKAVFTLDNGIMHLAASTSTPTVALFRHGIHRLWCPPFGQITALTAGESSPVSEISVETVKGALSGIV